VGTTPQIILTDHKDGGYAASVAAGGDVNGDGFGDLIVGESTDDWATTHAWVYFGSGDGIVASSATELEGPTVPGAINGPIVASAGDVNGDGYADVFVGADYFINRQGGTSMVYLGGPSGPSATPQVTLTAPNGDNLIYGSTPPCVIDVDGDGYADLALRGPSLSGNILLYRGGPSGITSSVPSSTELVAPVNDLAYGVSLASGDVDGDGFADLIVGSSDVNDSGVIYVYRGGAVGLETNPSTTVLAPDHDFGAFGTSIVAADVDGDGFADVVVGEFREEQDAGRAFLFTGSASGLAPVPATTFDAPDGGRFGNALATVADLTTKGDA
jgi:hypothetical protein